MRREDDEELIHDPQERVDEPDVFRPETKLSKEERRWVILGAMKSAFLIGSVYMVVLGLMIWIMLKIWM